MDESHTLVVLNLILIIVISMTYRQKHDFWKESYFRHFKFTSGKFLCFGPWTDGTAAIFHAVIYVVIIIGLLILDYNIKFHPGFLILFGFFISLAPRWYWWGICHRFEKWIFIKFIQQIKKPRSTEALSAYDKEKNADLEREIKYYRSHFNVHKEYALALWLAALAFLGTYLYSDVVTARTGIVRVNEYVELCRYSVKDVQLYRGPELRNEEEKVSADPNTHIYMKLSGRLTKEAAEIQSIRTVDVSDSENPKPTDPRDKDKWVKRKILKECQDYNPYS